MKRESLPFFWYTCASAARVFFYFILLPAISRTERTYSRIFHQQGGMQIETRLALIGIILENRESVDELNHLLSEYGEYVIGRMGIPYREKGIHVISVAMDAPGNVISALSGKLGMLPGVSTKTIYGKNIC